MAALAISESMLANESILEFKKAEKAIPIPTDFKELENLGVIEKGYFILDYLLLSFVDKMRKGKGTELFRQHFKDVYRDKYLDIKLRIKSWKHPLFMYRCLANILCFIVLKKEQKVLTGNPRPYR